MKRHILSFHISIGPRTLGASYPMWATFERQETRSELRLPDHLIAATGDLLGSGAPLPLGDPAALGRTLGRALFAPPLRDLLLGARAAARSGGRLQIQLQISAPELAALPWELITLGVARPWSPALRDDYTLVRVSRSARPPAPATVAGPLSILAAAGPDEDLQLEALAVALEDAVRVGRIDLRLLRDATPATLERALRQDPPHILHLTAPVGLNERGAPRLMLRRGLDTADLAEILAEIGSLRLITLAGPQGDASSAGMALPTLATTLLRDEIPATIAFGGPLPARLAGRFAASCYDRLAAGSPVDLAVTAGRRALAEYAGGRGWGLIQLRLTPSGEQLFSFRHSRRAGARRRSIAPLIGVAAALLLALLLGARMITRAKEPVVQALVGPTSGLTVAQLAPTEPPTAPATESPATIELPTESIVPTPIPAPSSYATYMTVADDTLAAIAERMGSDADAIAALNRLDPAVPLRAEHPLVIPVYRAGAAGAGGLVIRRGNPAEPKVALTFDIEIDDKTLYGILDILRSRGLHGTFFLTGHWVMTFPDAAKAIVKEGHEIANHSLTHPSFSRIGLDGAASELEKTEQIIVQTIGVTSRPYFRFPYGDFTADTAAVVAREGYVAYHWSADDAAIPGWLDWAGQHQSEAYGGILLMHGRQSTVDGLPGWLDRLAVLGLQPVTLGEVLR